jgi:hypothetical protein
LSDERARELHRALAGVDNDPVNVAQPSGSA